MSGCHKSAPPIRFAPSDTDIARLRSEFALTPAERAALTPETLKLFTQDELDQIYKRLEHWADARRTVSRRFSSFRGAAISKASVGELSGASSDLVTKDRGDARRAAGRAFWRGKVFFRSSGHPAEPHRRPRRSSSRFIPDPDTIPKLTFDGRTTWLLFPAKLSCGNSLLDPANRSIVIDYAKGFGSRRLPRDPGQACGTRSARHPRRGAAGPSRALSRSRLLPRSVPFELHAA